MNIEFDSSKNERNLLERGISFDRTRDFEFETALFVIDDRQDYGETRIRAFGMLGGRLHALVFVETRSGIRVISLRKANVREVKRYEQETEG
ncbi:MAG: BrnT family toxin [Burkholderiaceae bacterium]